MRVNTRYINSIRGTSCVYIHWMYLWWSLCTLYLHACLVSYSRRPRSLLLYLCYVYRALINSLVCSFCTSALGLVMFQIFFYMWGNELCFALVLTPSLPQPNISGLKDTRTCLQTVFSGPITSTFNVLRFHDCLLSTSEREREKKKK